MSRPGDRQTRSRFASGAAVLKFLGVLALFLHLFGCTSALLLNNKERATIDRGEKALVLLRVDCVVDGKPYEGLIPSLSKDPVVFFGLGSFDTMGEPRWTFPRFLSLDSATKGWTYFLLAPGLYYLSVLGPETRTSGHLEKPLQEEAPRWKIEVPVAAKLVYAGTLRLEGKSEKRLGAKVIAPIGKGEMIVENEAELARSLLAEHFLTLGEPRILIMQRWVRGEPVIIRTPLRHSK